MDRQLIFKEFLPRNLSMENRADRIWIHPNGRTVVLLDGVSGCCDPVAAVEKCTDYLVGIESNPGRLDPSELLLALHANISSQPDHMSVAACVHFENEKAVCAWVGNPRLYLVTDESITSLLGEPLNQPTQVLGMQGKIVPMEVSFFIPAGGICLLTSDGMGHQAIQDRKIEIQGAHSNRDWQTIGEESAVDDDWSLVVFPIEQSFNFEKNSWPYNPFLGTQEEREHEKRGLAQLADALFADGDFDGFRIVGGTRFARGKSSRLLDGILVSPWGVVCLELKDHDGQVILPLAGGREMKISDGQSHHIETNPVPKLTEALRPFSSFDLGCDIRTELRNIGAVVFTHRNAQVTCQLPDGTESPPPLSHAEIIITSPEAFPRQLKKYVKDIVGKRAKAPLEREQIKSICECLLGQASLGLKLTGEFRKIDRFVIGNKPNEAESTDYYEVYDGRFANRDRKVWVKKFPRAHLARGIQSQVEESRLREIEALLPFHGEGGIQQYLGKDLAEDGLFVILEHIEGLRLDQWLETQPSREERLDLLKQLVQILMLLNEEQIVHRALSPLAVRIRASNCQPVLVNFELCQMEMVSTLPLNGRRLFDIQYVAKEVHTLGAQVSPASDIYSFGKIVCFTLAGKLPFRTFEDQPMTVKKPGFWENFSRDCGLTDHQGKELARMMSINPDRRPSPKETLAMLEGWQ